MLNPIQDEQKLKDLMAVDMNPGPAMLPSAARSRIGQELVSVFHDAAAPDLARDVDDAMAGRRAGHLVRHVFNDSAMPRWQAFAGQVPNYGSREEEGIIRDEAGYLGVIGDELRKAADGKPVILVEFGTGASLDTKTVPTVAHVRPDDYIAVDYAAGAAFEAATHVRDQFQRAIRPHMRVVDFTKGNLKLPDAGAQIFVMYGQTLGNCDGFPGQPLNAPVNQTIANLRRHMKPGDYLLLGLLREQKMEEAYNHPLFHAFHEEFPHYMKERLSPEAHVVPEDFQFFVKWLPDMSNHVFGYTAKNNGWIRPLSQKYHYKKGDTLMVTCNSARFTQDFLDDMASTNALKERRILTNGQGRTYIHAYQAV
jgi:uncharacterized SAM-dependent methyltransferase